MKAYYDKEKKNVIHGLEDNEKPKKHYRYLFNTKDIHANAIKCANIINNISSKHHGLKVQENISRVLSFRGILC